MPKLLSGLYEPTFPMHLYEHFIAVYKGLYSDANPESCTWPHMGYSGRPWKEAPGPLQDPRDKMWKQVSNIRSDSGRKIEKEYFSLYLPRNCHWGDITQDKLRSINHIVPRPKDFSFPTVDQCIYILRHLGFGRRHYCFNGYGNIQPADGSASLGYTYDPTKDRHFVGSKKSFWALIQQSAIRYRDDIVGSLHLSWRDPPSAWQIAMHHLRRYLIAATRDDTGKGAINPRILWMGDGIDYLLETDLFTEVRKDFKDSDVVPHHADDVCSRFAQFADTRGHFLSMDFSRWDLTQYAESQKRVWKAVSLLYKFPSDLAVYCCAYNLCAPLVLSTGKTLVVNHRYGIQPSGVGSFVWINHFLHLIYDIWLMHLSGLSLDDAIANVGQVYGDDGWVHTKLSADTWSKLCYQHFGLVMKPMQVHTSSDTMVFCRKLYRMDHTGPCIEPVVMSRWRNALTPSITTPSMASDALKAIIARAQFLEILAADAGHGLSRYSNIIKLWVSTVREETFLLGQTDKELIAGLSPHERGHADTLLYLKAFHKVNDFTELL